MQAKKSNKLILGYSSFVSNLLINRNITNEKEADYYFNANFDDLSDYWTIKDLKESAYFIKNAIQNKKKIIVFGDYDVDGVTSTDIMVETIQDCGGNVDWRLPCRIKEGYGINIKAIKEIIKEGYDLIITVDNGIRAINEIQYAREHGVDVVVLDHHIVGKTLPNANFVVDLHREDEVYPYREFAGCGVAFMMARALYFLFDFPDDYCKKHLDVVAIGTIADVMSLTGENRILVKEGLKMLCDTTFYNRVGILQLMRLNFLSDNIYAMDIGFKIAPCLNAPGRLLENGADWSLKLLLEKDALKANEIASFLYRINEIRKTKTKQGLELAEQYIANNNLYNDKVLVVYVEGIEEGIIGLISGKLTEKYYKPSIVFTKNVVGNYKASARSIETVDLYECLCSCHPLFVKYGGHEQAAGMEIKPENFETLRTQLNIYVNDNFNDDCFVKPEFFEWEISVDEINMNLIEELQRFEPCGNGNERPLLWIKEYPTVKRKTKYSQDISYYSIYGDSDEHVTLYGQNSDLQGFGLGDKFEDLGRPDVVSALVDLSVSNSMGFKQIILSAKDINPAIIETKKVVVNTSVKNKIQNLADLL